MDKKPAGIKVIMILTIMKVILITTIVGFLLSKQIGQVELFKALEIMLPSFIFSLTILYCIKVRNKTGLRGFLFFECFINLSQKSYIALIISIVLVIISYNDSSNLYLNWKNTYSEK